MSSETCVTFPRLATESSNLDSLRHTPQEPPRTPEVVIGQVAIAGAFIVFWHSREAVLTTAHVGALALVVWVNLSFAVRRTLMKQERPGTFLQTSTARIARSI